MRLGWKKNAAVARFCIDFAAREEQSLTKILSSPLKQIVDGLERIPTKIMIVQAFRDQGKVIGGRELELSKIVEMLQDLTTFVCVEALDTGKSCLIH